jgi:hypothetical protein
LVCFENLSNIGHYHRTHNNMNINNTLWYSHGKETMWSVAQTPLDALCLWGELGESLSPKCGRILSLWFISGRIGHSKFQLLQSQLQGVHSQNLDDNKFNKGFTISFTLADNIMIQIFENLEPF